jgi:hypothetical protein
MIGLVDVADDDDRRRARHKEAGGWPYPQTTGMSPSSGVTERRLPDTGRRA